ncbi:MAG: DMT family transporter [bacterium]|nr:MAG: DMT family transporter [bacterium]
MIWLLPSAACSIAIALILKVNEERTGDRVLLAGANYSVASVLSLALLGFRIGVPGGTTVILGATTGVIFVLGFLLLMAGIARGPLAIPVTVMRLSVVVPITASILIWREQPSPLQWIGITLGIVAILTFGLSLPETSGRRGGRRGYAFFILSLFIVMGIADLLLKSFRELSPDTERFLFTWLLFTVASMCTWILVVVRRIPFDRRTFVLGLILGVPNLFSTVFMLMALRDVAASIAFPFVNLTVIFGSTLLALLIWKERLKTLAVFGLVLAGAAIVLLPMG